MKTFTYSALFFVMCIGWAGCETLESIQQLYAAESLDIDNEFDYDYSEESSFGLEPRIVGGRESVPHSHPYIVKIRGKDKSGPFSCGGSILTNEWVLTAAHCLQNAYSVTVRAGSHDLSKKEKNSRQKVNGTKLLQHGYYNEKNYLRNDIGLVKVKPKFKFDKFVKPAVLADKTWYGHGPATVAGWGQISESNNLSSWVLREVDVNIITNTKCQEMLPRSKIFNSSLCAYKIGKDACEGDSGSPLFVKINGKEIVVGIVSWGRGCARKDKPGVYTRVNKYLKWIRETTGYGKCHLKYYHTKYKY